MGNRGSLSLGGVDQRDMGKKNDKGTMKADEGENCEYQLQTDTAYKAKINRRLREDDDVGSGKERRGGRDPIMTDRS